jgi:plastocyanin
MTIRLKSRACCCNLMMAALLLASAQAGAQAGAQEPTLSARVKVTESGPKTGSPQAGNGAGNVVVWLTPIGAHAPARPFPNHPLRLTQHNKSFEPHLLVVPVGAVVQFPNRDPFFHNVFSLFEGKRFDLGLYEAGTTRNVSFDRPGVSYIFCNIHAEMSAVVIALDSPYFGISDPKGEVVIPQVPTGRYTLRGWYETALPETLNAMTREINVTESSSTLGVLEIPSGPAATAHKNKYGMDYEPATPNSPAYDHP